LVLDSIIFNLNINTKFLELYTSCNFISKIAKSFASCVVKLDCYVKAWDEWIYM